MKVLALDISTSTGYSVQKHDGKVELLEQGSIVNDKRIEDFGAYPFSYYHAAKNMARLIQDQIAKHKPDAIVIEETNGSRSRYTQKILEFLHYAVLDRLVDSKIKIVYINTSDWRKSVGGMLSKEDKKQNAKVAKAKQKAKVNGKLDLKKFSALKKEMGVRGKVNKKHVAIRVVNEMFDLSLKAKDDDVADAICLGLALYNGVPHCDGKK
jgi:Holliday junction resolvasome RuvABC endonuclease subunit